MEKYYTLDELTAKAKTRKEISEEYGIDRKTLKLRLSNSGLLLQPRVSVFPSDLVKIYNTLGLPKVNRKM